MLNHARRLAADVTAHKLPAEEPVRLALERIDARNHQLLALRSVDRDGALAAAHDVTSRIARGASLPLAGVPIVIKDNIAQQGHPNDAGTRGGLAPVESQDALLLQRLRSAGAIVIGRANMDELAYGVTGTNPHVGQLRNPWNVAKHPGGSSAGSAAAVAASFASLAVGTDTAGSVRIPSALCGVVGLRPTPGLVPTHGVAPLAPSFDSPGPIANHVDDVALMLAVMADRPSLSDAPRDPSISLKSLRVLHLSGAFATPVSDPVQASVLHAVESLAKLGAAVRNASIAQLADAPRASGPIIGAEASFAWKKRLVDHPGAFSETVTGHLQKGATITAVRYLQAQDECRRVARAVHDALDDADILALPTTATVATDADAPGAQLVFLALTVPFSIAGTPSISVPIGVVDGLPAGLQLVSRPGSEALLLRVAHELQQAVGMLGHGS